MSRKRAQIVSRAHYCIGANSQLRVLNCATFAVDQYRLCKRGRNITEECFQEMPLEPATVTHEIVYGPLTPQPKPAGWQKRSEIPAVHVRQGTKGGSTWIRNPIPACYGPTGGGLGNSPAPCHRAQFPPPIPGLFGFGPTACIVASADALTNFSMLVKPCMEQGWNTTACVKYNLKKYTNCSFAELFSWVERFNFNIVDTLKVPDAIGDYVLSFRWDSEQSPQIWTGCSDIRIV